jgi:hypothetical protein
MIDPATGWIEIVEATNKSATSIQDFFITPGWQVTRDLNLLSLTIGTKANSNVSSNKCVTIMALKTNQLQVTTHKQMQSLSEYTKLSMTCSDHLTRKTIMKI